MNVLIIYFTINILFLIRPIYKFLKNDKEMIRYEFNDFLKSTFSIFFFGLFFFLFFEIILFILGTKKNIKKRERKNDFSQ